MRRDSWDWDYGDDRITEAHLQDESADWLLQCAVRRSDISLEVAQEAILALLRLHYKVKKGSAWTGGSFLTIQFESIAALDSNEILLRDPMVTIQDSQQHWFIRNVLPEFDFGSADCVDRIAHAAQQAMKAAVARDNRQKGFLHTETKYDKQHALYQLTFAQFQGVNQSGQINKVEQIIRIPVLAGALASEESLAQVLASQFSF